ncbi:response regulator [Rheinheimera sp.]|jgi:two-component system OmpR family response regulator/two-component system response regulator QseB|uniref:response regulator n=1 Tax=Rheinheimera sp. TaxID=1869214 RepID=UPI003AF651FF
MRILLVEDDQLLAKGLIVALERLHYRVEHCLSGKQALQAAQNSTFDVMILDLGLPDGLALPVIRKLRANQQALPILVLTAWDHLETKIEALDAGADDYVLKPCDVREIEARLRVILRRHQQRHQDILVSHELLLDIQRHTCTFQDKPVHLTTREFLLLKELMLHQGKIVSKQHLEEINTGWNGDNEGNSLEVHIHNIRKKTAAYVIKTIRGFGYTLKNHDEN